ncbi:MAG: hypothetical protein HDR09_21255 [Lachnospiraceae bacterium]|nr:hypothetical protein [Lachnospiraceae bacterium]MBD5506205.1 hypothetical protein [Lachnospiraceae bacterium]
MKMKKVRRIRSLKAATGGMVIIGSLVLGACGAHAKGAVGDGSRSGQSPTAEETVQCVMESMRILDLDTFNACTDNYVQTKYNWIGVPIRSEYRVFNELLQPGLKLGKRKERYEFSHKLSEKIMENLTWEIKAVKEDNDKAELVMEITNLDMNGVMGMYEMSIMENMIESEGTGLKQMIKDLSSITDKDGSLLTFMKSCDKDETCTLDVTAVAYLENGAWIVHLDDELINACMGNINAEEYSEEVQQEMEKLEKELNEKLSEEVQQEMEGLEKQLDEKLDEWEDEFTEKVERWADGLF